MSKILFIIKTRNTSYGVSFGLLNSALANAEGLIKMGHEASVVQVIDGNGIDKEVYNYKPTHVIIEAIWATPQKMEVLCKKYSKIKFLICAHSKTPFIANEGIAFPWLTEYAKLSEIYPNLLIGCNNEDFNEDLQTALNKTTICIPNMYFKRANQFKVFKTKSDVVKIGCFGSLRPMKNHLQQAIASIKFANMLGKKLEFHINSGRAEQNGENVLKNLKAIFQDSNHELVCHDWLSHDDFIKLIQTMDIGLQVSLTESFNIVTADFVHCGVPIVVSEDVKWMPKLAQCKPTETTEIVNALRFYYSLPILEYLNRVFLREHNEKASWYWSEFLS